MTVPPSIHAAMRSAVDDGVFPGAVLAVRLRGRLLDILPVGRLSTDAASRPVAADTVYDLASLTKPLATVTSILVLIQEGRLALDHRIGKVVVELMGSEIGSASIQDLLSHSSGLPGWRPLYEQLEAKRAIAGCAPPSIIQQTVLHIIGEQPLIYPKTTKSLYSDLGFILLGCAVERVGGLPLDQFFDQRIAKLFGVRDLRFRPCAKLGRQGTAALSDDLARVAPTEWDEWRGRLSHGEVHDENAASLGGVAGHAGLFGTAEAVLAMSDAWLGAYHRRPSPLDQELVRRFTTKQRHIPDSSWALGWDTPSAPSSSGSYLSPESFGHLGYTGTSLWIDPKRELEVVLLSNRVCPTRKNEKIREFRPRLHDLVAKECGLGG